MLQGGGPKAFRARRRRLGRHTFHLRVGAFATTAAAAGAAVVVVLSGVSGGPSLVDRAYAAITATHQVLHEVDIRIERNLHRYTDRVEGWLLPATGQARLIATWGYRGTPFVSEWIISAAGQVFSRACLAHCHPASFVDGRARWSHVGHVDSGGYLGFPGTLPGTFAKLYRAAYHDHAIVEDGAVSFDRRRVACLQSMTPSFGAEVVFWRPGASPPASARKYLLHISGAYSLITWYVDPATAQPVGFTASPCDRAEMRSCGQPESTTRIVTYERLDPTNQNLALLTGPNAPGGAR